MSNDEQQAVPIPAFYSVIPADVRYHKGLSANAKLMYGEITALSNQRGYCFASNKYFMELYKAGERSITRWISSLVKAGFIITFDHIADGKVERRIKIADSTFDTLPLNQEGGSPKLARGGSQNWRGGVAKIGTHNNIDDNNTGKDKIQNTPPIIPLKGDNKHQAPLNSDAGIVTPQNTDLPKGTSPGTAPPPRITPQAKEAFETCRLLYPGKKGGLHTELEHFIKKCKGEDLLELTGKITEGIKKEIGWRAWLRARDRFVPEWKYFKTWINGRCWEQEFDAEFLKAMGIKEEEKPEPGSSRVKDAWRYMI